MIHPVEGHPDIDVEIFTDGNMSEVVRRGDTVYRVRAPWSDAAHQVLRHLERQGYPYAPRILHVDVDDNREELSFVPGRSIPADLDGFEDVGFLVQLGSMIRSLHDALKGFEFAPGTEYVRMVHAPSLPTLVCHCDIGPWNTIVSNGEMTGLIDWDLVGPGTAEWELAYAAWRFAPVYPEGRTRFTVAEQAHRIVVLLDAYELPAARRQGFVQQMLERMRSAIDTVEFLGQQRVPGFDALYDSGLHLSGIDDHAWLTRYQEEVTRIVERRPM